MKKKALLACLFTVTLSLCSVVFAATLKENYGETSGNFTFSMELNSTTDVEEVETGILHQISVKRNVFDMVGWDSNGGDFGSIRRKLHGPSEYNYPGMIYNRSYLNGFKTLKVDFSGGNVYCVFSDFLMEDMEFNGTQMQSGVAVNVPDGKAYFIVYTNSITPVNVDSVKVEYSCGGEIDNQLIYDSSDASNMGGARSWTSKITVHDNFVDIENNPTIHTNNYSHGHNISQEHDDSWYRWNGRYLRESDNLGTNFSFGMTIAGSYKMMTDESKNFHYNVWPQFSYGDTSDEPWVQTYIGNDNYEPLGTAGRLFPDDKNADPSYTGRFFTDYDWNGSKWCFLDPDIATIADGVTTFREAYETYNLPFWFIQFDVYLENDEPMCDVSINGFKLYTYEIFEKYDKVNKPDIYLKTLPMHIVNYGHDVNATPDDPYSGSFTYPRKIA